MDITNQIAIPAATDTAAGAMTALDRIKMTKLFDRTMLDAQHPEGYHRHNYLEMGDLPPIVSLSAANYQEFKDAAAKLQPEIAAGKFGEIVQTGDWMVEGSDAIDVTGIRLVRQGGSVRVDKNPLRLTTKINNLELNNMYFQGHIGGQQVSNITSLHIQTTVETDIFLNNTTFFYTNGTNITIANGKTIANVMIDKYRNGVSGNITSEPLRIRYQNTAYPFVCVMNNMPTDVSNNNIEVSYPAYQKTPAFYTDGSCNFINVQPPAKVTLLQSYFTASPLAGLVPAPTAAQKTPYHFLNAKGEWVDIRTIIGA